MRKKVLLIISCILLICVVVFGICSYNSNLKLEINGASDVTLSYNDKYNDEGFKASLNGKEINNEVKVKSNIDYSKLGTYEIKYSISHFFRKLEQKRIIKIVDTTSPVITLKGPSVISININNEYNDEGYSVTDNYDKDLDSKVTVTNNLDTKKAGTYEIKYSVTDSSGNTTEVKRTIIVNDNVSNSKPIPVLMYHFFYDSNVSKPYDNNWMNINLFEEQVKFLVDNNYYFPTWDEINDYLDKKISLPNKSIVITADDGNISFFNLAYPVLKKYNVRATSFIVTSWTKPSNDYDQNILSYQSHSNDMHKGGCTGGHGGKFRCIDDKAGLNDLTTSKQIANNAIVFCYPFGDVTDKEVSLVKEAGYKMAFTTSGGKIKPGMDKYRLPRVRMSNGITLNSFVNSIK